MIEKGKKKKVLGWGMANDVQQEDGVRVLAGGRVGGKIPMN